MAQGSWPRGAGPAPGPGDAPGPAPETLPLDRTEGATKKGIGQKYSFRFPVKANRAAMLLLGMTITTFAWGAAHPQNRHANQHTPRGGVAHTPSLRT